MKTAWIFSASILVANAFFIQLLNSTAFAQSKPAKPAAPSAGAETVLATVGEAKIYLNQFNAQYDRIAASAANPPTKMQFLEDIIRMEAGVQEAKKTGKDKDPRVQQSVKQALYTGLLELELGEKIQKIPQATNKDLEEYYKRNPELRFSYILIDIKPNATPAERELAHKRAQEILKEVRQSKRPFRELVKIYSDDTISKVRDGDAGWHRRSTLTPFYYVELLKLKKGQVSDLIETPLGFHIAHLSDIRSFESASIALTRVEWFEEQKVKIGKQYTDQLRSKYTVQIQKDLLK